jgi:hypothetical protein
VWGARGLGPSATRNAGPLSGLWQQAKGYVAWAGGEGGWVGGGRRRSGTAWSGKGVWEGQRVPYGRQAASRQAQPVHWTTLSSSVGPRHNLWQCKVIWHTMLWPSVFLSPSHSINSRPYRVLRSVNQQVPVWPAVGAV